MCILTAWLKTSHPIRLCSAHSFHLHAIHDVWLSVSSCLSFSCFSLLFTSSLPHSACSDQHFLSNDNSVEGKNHCAIAQRGVLPHGDMPSSHRLRAQRPWRLPPLRDSWNDLPGGIQRRRSGALVLARRGTRRRDRRRSAIFTTFHSGARRNSGPKTSLSLSWRKFVVKSVVVCRSC